jgi:hypothetical protein
VRGKVIHETIEIFLHQQKAFDQTEQNGVQYVVDWFLEKRKWGAPFETMEQHLDPENSSVYFLHFLMLQPTLLKHCVCSP